jgi:di/tricarboxylate transporter
VEWQGWIALAVVVSVTAVLVTTHIAADVVFIGGVTILLVLGVLSPKEALEGMANEGMLTVGVLFVIAAAVRETGCLDIMAHRVLGRPRSVLGAQARLMLPVTALSAFLNNTPIVAMMMPVVSDWAKKHRISVSKLMIPLSYATILGGTCTLIGTSTNLVVHGLLVKHAPGLAMNLFDLAWVGVPSAILGLAYVLLVGRKLLPDRRPVLRDMADPREYTVEMLVEPGSPLVGRTIEQAGLRHLSGMYLMEIDRDGEVLPAVSSDERLHPNDRVVFVGVVDSVVDLQKIRGLVPATDQVFKLDAPRFNRCLIEAVVSNTCPLVGRTIREGRFRSVYNAAVIAVARSGQRIRKKIGDIVLQPGDTLLLEAHPFFEQRHRNSRDFFLVSAVENSTPPRYEKTWTAALIFAGMVLGAGTGVLSMLTASMVAAGLMIATRCISVSSARASVDWQILLVIAAAFGISRALELTGAAAFVARGLLGLSGESAWGALAAVYGVTMLFNAFMSNNAAAALMFPIAMGAAGALGVSPRPFAVAIMMAGSNDFATPIGYQTNLMVYGPGGYRFRDYVRIGSPLNLLLWGAAVAIIPRIWRF